jgi:hypothetical protein
MKEINDIENKYGLVLFRMGLSHLMDSGIRNFDDKLVADYIAQIMAKAEEDKANGVNPVMSPEFQCEIVRCAAELSHFSVWTLFAYIKEYVVIQR